MNRKEIRVNDKVWIHIGKPPANELVEGTVAHFCTVPNYNDELYIIRLDTAIEPIFECRTYSEISFAKDQPINAFVKSQKGNLLVFDEEEPSNMATSVFVTKDTKITIEHPDDKFVDVPWD